MYSRIRRPAVAVFPTGLAVLALMAGCGKSSSTASSGSDLSLSGTFGSVVTSGGRIAIDSSASRSRSSVDALSILDDGANASLSVDLTTYSLSCATSDVPPVTVTGTISASGAFNLSIPDGVSKALTCSVLDSAGNTVATLLLKDTSHKDMNGNPQVNGTPAFGASTTKLGSVTLDLTTGDAAVPSSQVTDASGNSAVVSASAVLAGGTPFDPTGEWQITDVDFNLPKGVLGVCAMGDQHCDGPPGGANIYLNRLVGTSTVDGSTVYGMQVWQDNSQANNPKSAMDACGDMTGLSTADATTAGVDLSSYGNKNGPFTFAQSFTDSHASNATATLANGWEASTAKAQWTMQACVSKTITSGGRTYNLWVCGPDSTYNHYQASLGGGCTDSSGNAVNISNWSQVQWTNNSCQTTAVTGLSGFFQNSCSATYNSKTITCTNVYGVFADQNLTTPVVSNGMPGSFDYSAIPTLMTANVTSCSAVTDALMKDQCYANYYEMYVRGHVSGCIPRVDMDWSSTDPAKFAHADFRPDSLVFMDKLSYSDANTGSMLTEQTQYNGVQVADSSGNQQWVNCALNVKGGLFFKKISDSKILATYTSQTVTTSLDKPACVATYGNVKEKYMFYLIKQ